MPLTHAARYGGSHLRGRDTRERKTWLFVFVHLCMCACMHLCQNTCECVCVCVCHKRMSTMAEEREMMLDVYMHHT